MRRAPLGYARTALEVGAEYEATLYQCRVLSDAECKRAENIQVGCADEDGTSTLVDTDTEVIFVYLVSGFSNSSSALRFLIILFLSFSWSI